jgi:hypothetical protein
MILVRPQTTLYIKIPAAHWIAIFKFLTLLPIVLFPANAFTLLASDTNLRETSALNKRSFHGVSCKPLAAVGNRAHLGLDPRSRCADGEERKIASQNCLGIMLLHSMVPNPKR